MIPGVNMGILQWSWVFLEDYFGIFRKTSGPKNTLQNIKPLKYKDNKQQLTKWLLKSVQEASFFYSR